MPQPSTASPPPDHRPGAPAEAGAPVASATADATAAPHEEGASAVSPALPRPAASPPAGSEAGWSPPRLVRLGAPRPGPAARRAHRFGVPLVPLLVAVLVAGAFLAVGSGAEQDLSADGRQGGEQAETAAPAVGDNGDATPSTVEGPADPHGDGSAAAGTRTDDTPTADGATDTAPARTASALPSPRPDGGAPGGSPTPSRTGSTVPTSRPTATATHGSAPPRPVSFEALRVGDCFDIDRDAPGTALRRSCDTPHNAEVVARLRLTGVLATDAAVREAATLLCREPLRRKAALQPLGTRWTTFVQYPYRTSYLLGSDTVACSLVAPSATGGTLTERLL
ncbi:hypothetical protein [Streptomyces sp. NPDC058326]|uniref:hypothetical protein n=1 Tax=Streptomyces sp. NPDC058326 TaxID=3346447 RepID=UPI0036E452EF